MDIKKSIEQFILEELLFSTSDKEMDPDESLISSGVIDSLAILRLITFVEETFGVTVEDAEVVPENFETINIIAEFVEAKK